MSATTDAILAAGPTAVALAAIYATTWEHRRGREHEREMRDLADTRALMDDATVALYDASRALSELERALFRHGSGMRLHAPDALVDAERAGQALRVLRGRLAVRLPGDHPAVRAFGQAHDATWEAIRAAFGQDPSPDADAQNTHRALDSNHRTLISATDAFVDAATATVGAQLPAGRAGPVGTMTA